MAEFLRGEHSIKFLAEVCHLNSTYSPLTLMKCFNTIFHFSLKGLLREGSEGSPILHLRLQEPFETFEEDEEKLKQVVDYVSRS